MPRQSPTREDAEVGAEDRDRRIERVMKYILMVFIPIICFVILGMGFAHFIHNDKTEFNTYSIPISLLGFATLTIMIFFYLWLSKPGYRRELRGQYRNFRRAIRRIRLPEFCTRHLRRIHPQPTVMVNTISVRPQPTPPGGVWRRVHPQPRAMVNTISVGPQPTISMRPQETPQYAVAGCSVQIETPPVRPLTPTPPENSNIGTLSFSNFEDSHGSQPNVLHQD